MTTVAGTGSPQYNGDFIQATSASLHLPSDIAVDESGNRTANANEVSVNNDNNEQFETSDSRSNAGPSSSEVSRPRAEQNRRLSG